MADNFILPENAKSVFFIGIGGISMSSLALISKQHGIKVGGSDRTKSEMTEILEKNGIEVFYSHSANNLKGYDCVVYTAAISADNPELVYAKNNNIPTIYRADFLGSLMKPYDNKIGIAGMHGKSTVTGMISHIFLDNGKNSTVLNGAVTKELNGAFRVGDTDSFIFEACEYKDSFLSFFPDTAVLLNLEMDHVDYFHSLQQIKDSFLKYANKASRVVYNLNCENLHEVIEKYMGESHSFGMNNEKADFEGKNLRLSARGFSCFDIYHNRVKICSVELSIPGSHNAENALCAVAVAYLHGINPENAAKSMNSFIGVVRRNEFKGIMNGAFIYDDYAHHPSEIKASLSGLRKICKGRLFCIYQPHTYSRTAGLFDEFCESFADADEVVFADIYAAREKNTFGISSKDLANKICGARYYPDFESIAKYIKETAKSDDLVVTMGAGDIFKLHPLLLNG